MVIFSSHYNLYSGCQTLFSHLDYPVVKTLPLSTPQHTYSNILCGLLVILGYYHAFHTVHINLETDF